MRCGKESSDEVTPLHQAAEDDRAEQAAAVITRFVRYASVHKSLQSQLGAGGAGAAKAVAQQLASPKKKKKRRGKAATKARQDESKVKQAERRHHHRRRSSCASINM